MKKEYDGWKIVPASLPVWVTSNEKNFNELIEEELGQA